MPRASARLDRPVLVSNLVSGALWLLLLAAAGGWALSVIGVVYVVAGGLFLSAAYGRGLRSWRREVAAWVVPWLGAVALWVMILLGVENEGTASAYLLAVGLGAVLATACFLGWQVLALAIRQFLASRLGAPAQKAAAPHEE